MTDENAVEIVELTKVYKDFWGRPRSKAVDKLSFSIRRGEVFGLLGPNGSGKTTTLKILMGLLFPTSGAVKVLGKIPADVRAKERIGFLPEESYLYRFLNADETIDFYAKLFRIPFRERKARIDRLIKMVGLEEARRRPLKEYSKGMARRIGLAQSLVSDPDLILVDEPTTGLDPIGTREVKHLIVTLKERGKTVLLSSHLLADVEDVCDRIAILHQGRLKVIGDVKELLKVLAVTQISLKHPDPTFGEQMKKEIEGRGGEVLAIDNPKERLETLFLKIIKDGTDTGHRADKN